MESRVSRITVQRVAPEAGWLVGKMSDRARQRPDEKTEHCLGHVRFGRTMGYPRKGSNRKLDTGI